MRIEIPEELAADIRHIALGMSVEQFATKALRESVTKAKSSIPWWEADVTSLAAPDQSDASVWMEPQIKAWTDAD